MPPLPSRKLAANFNTRVRLYVLITADLCRKDWLQTASDAIAGGADCLQLREKRLDDGELLDRAKALSDLCHEHNVLFVMNDRPDIAVLARADGVHVGQEDLPVQAVRKIVGPELLVGLSTHSLDQARAAVQQNPDYVGVGPMFESSTKIQSVHAGPDILKQVLGEIYLPHVAIGGISSENVNQLTAVGCRTVAVCQSIIGAADPRAAAAAIKAHLQIIQ
jgi:thiamine-phosphate pyrophosphorylase